MILEIKDLDINGDGISYYHKKVVFVKGALPGEVVNVKKVREEKNYIKAEITKFVKKSPKRVKPKCQLYQECGGCNIMHLNYQEQLHFKKRLLEEAFDRYASIQPTINDTLGMVNPFNYRNKAQLHLKKNKNLIMGLFKENSNFIIDIPNCDVQDKKLNQFLKKLRKAIEESDIEISKNALNRVMVRTNGDEFQVVLVSKRKMKYGKLLDDIKKISNVHVFESVVKSHLFLEQTSKLYGKERIMKKVGDKSFYVRPRDFFQLNDGQTEVLYNEVKKLVGSEKTIVDCYAGVGSIGQYIATNQEVRGIEIIATAVESAKDNARVNKVNANYKKGSVGEIFKRWSKEGYRPELVVFDPPRVGLDEESITTLIKTKPRKIIYVSCNPATLAKNVNELLKYYDVKSVQPIDMFPHTSNVESITLLERKH